MVCSLGGCEQKIKPLRMCLCAGVDMWAAMKAARHLIYIANWHFTPEQDNPYEEGSLSIGELLKMKASEGATRSEVYEPATDDVQ